MHDGAIRAALVWVFRRIVGVLDPRTICFSGGALVTGNILNIVAASGLGITSREWSRIGLGTAARLLLLCFATLTAMTFFP